MIIRYLDPWGYIYIYIYKYIYIYQLCIYVETTCNILES